QPHITTSNCSIYDTATPKTNTLSLPDALPICRGAPERQGEDLRPARLQWQREGPLHRRPRHRRRPRPALGPHRSLAEGRCDGRQDRKSTRLNSSHVKISYAVFCLKKKKITYSK